MNKEIEKLEKQIKKTEQKETFFDKLADNMIKVKCGAAICFAGLVISTIFMPAVYYYIFGALGLIVGVDLIVESKTNYGENICDKICQKYAKQVRDLKKQKERTESEVDSVVNKEEIKEAAQELGLDNKIVVEKAKDNAREEIEEEKE